MSKDSSAYAHIHWLIIAATVGLILLDAYRYHGKSRAWVESSGKVLRSSYGYSDDVALEVSYEFEGLQRTATLRTSGDPGYFRVSSRVSILINPRNPDQCILKRLSHFGTGMTL